MKKLLPLYFALMPFALFAQPNWSEDVAAIFYGNCTGCHNPNGIGPFSLIDYNDAVTFSGNISSVVQNGTMPPWTADTTYKRYLHERVLSQSDIDAIVDWVQAGTPQGDLNLAPPPPVFDATGILKDPDLIVKMPVYKSKAVANDDYVCIAVPSGLTTERKIKAVEIVPGNRSIVHHVLVFIDAQGTYQSDTVGGNCGGPSSGDLVTVYAPGGQPTFFPNGGDFKTGVTMPVGSNVILAMHYPEGTSGMKDSTEVHFFFHPEGETNVREVHADRLVENWSFCIPANTTKELKYAYPSLNGTTSAAISLLSVLPHMHLLGQSMRSYALLPSQDTLPLVSVPQYDFEWQDAYFFKKPQVLPVGSRLYGEGFYDNTSNNPNNPNDPPIQVCAGLNTSDEMFLFYYHYLNYQLGDENVNIDSLMNPIPTGVDRLARVDGRVKVIPNPSADQVTFSIHAEQSGKAALYIYDQLGHLVNIVLPMGSTLTKGENQLHWNGNNLQGAPVAPGVYHYSLRMEGSVLAGQVVRW